MRKINFKFRLITLLLYYFCLNINLKSLNFCSQIKIYLITVFTYKILLVNSTIRILTQKYKKNLHFRSNLTCIEMVFHHSIKHVFKFFKSQRHWRFIITKYSIKIFLTNFCKRHASQKYYRGTTIKCYAPLATIIFTFLIQMSESKVWNIYCR